ncbi:MAG: hypothetical protein WAQ98_27185 [Blastocatellia bacterium]
MKNKIIKNNINLNGIKNKLNNHAGEGVSGLIALLTGTVITIAVLALITVMVLIPKPNGTSVGTGDGTGEGELAKGETNNLPSNPNTNNIVDGYKETNNLPTQEAFQDTSTGVYLVCMNLPGINFPRTPALDRRVAQMYLAVKRDLDQQGIPPLEFSWAFRSNCQQVNVVPSPNPNNRTGRNSKAEPGKSPHEAGRGLDVRGMKTRKDRGLIIKTFNRHGWKWLGETDPPHFEILYYQVGEGSHIAWISKIQQSFKQGYPKEGCRGTECGQ